MFAAALAALALALARPQATVAVPVEQASVLLVTDVSGSMKATDVEPTRLDAARSAALDFLDDVPDEVRVGAVAYSTVPHTLDRPGTDRSSVEDLIENLSADGGTATGDALDQALELLGPREGREADARGDRAALRRGDHHGPRSGRGGGRGAPGTGARSTPWRWAPRRA